MTWRQQRQARRLVKLACERLLERPADVHYTEGPGRWESINNHKGITKAGFWPFYGDCSSTATWVLWRALWIPFRSPDVVNGESWDAGYTGTMLQHGVAVPTDAARLGDLVIYNGHVAVALGDGTVMSHGSEGGPYRLSVRYRPDIVSTRRYIR